jgi:hypothetical protein
MVIEEAKVLLLQARDETTFLVRDGKDEIDLIGLDADGRYVICIGRSVIRDCLCVRRGWGRRGRRGAVRSRKSGNAGGWLSWSGLGSGLGYERGPG